MIRKFSNRVAEFCSLSNPSWDLRGSKFISWPRNQLFDAIQSELKPDQVTHN